MALYYGLFNDDEWDKAFAVLVDIIHRDGDKPVIGMLGLRTLFHVLAQGGEADLILTLMLREDCCTYGSMIAAGATSLWERLNEPNQCSTSHNHHCYSHISAFFIKDLAGIHYNPDTLDHTRCDIRPIFPTEVNDAEGYFDSPSGRIFSAWKRENDGITLTVEIPDGISGKLLLPKGWRLDGAKTEAALSTSVYKIVRE
jgi:alpha-L-rhamnosidase